MDDLFCYSCQRNYPAASHSAVLNEERERVCPVCRSDFVELVAPAAPQQPTNAAASGFPRLQGSLEVHMAASVFPSSLPAQTVVLQVSNGVFPALNLTGSGGSLPFSLGDFALGESLDQIVARIAELHQPPTNPTRQGVIDTLPRKPPLPKDATDKHQYASCKVGEGCTVCHEEFSEATQVVELPCQHCFHEDCILPWLREHNTCPVCRYKLPEATPSSAATENQQNRLMGVANATSGTSRNQPSSSAPPANSTQRQVNETQVHITQLQEMLDQQLNQHANLQQEVETLQQQRDRLHHQYQQLTEAGQQAATRLADIMERRNAAAMRVAETTAPSSDASISAAETSSATAVVGASTGTVEAQAHGQNSPENEHAEAVTSFEVDADSELNTAHVTHIELYTEPVFSGSTAHVTRSNDTEVDTDPEFRGSTAHGTRSNDTETASSSATNEMPSNQLNLASTPQPGSPRRTTIASNVASVPRALFGVVRGVVVRPVAELASIAGRTVRRMFG